MKTTIAKILACLAAVIVAGVMSASPALAQACLGKREIQEAVASGQIQSLDAVLAAAGVSANADILSVQVCDEGGRLVYVIGVLSPSGEAQNLVLGAQ